MNNKTAYTLMLLFSILMVAFVVRYSKVLESLITLDALSLLFASGLFLICLSCIGRVDASNDEKQQKKIHDERAERVKWLMEPVIERRKKELMQKSSADVK